MTTLSQLPGLQPLSTLPDLADISLLPKPVRRAAVDSIIHESRQKTPKIVADMREVPRKSIAELNEEGWNEVRERFLRSRIDDRGPVTRFLDLLDLPRNIILNLAAPGIARRKKEAGETGAFGLGVVRFADVLDDLGVDNRIVRGVLGFIGDVAFDPLTYLGPAGWGAKLATTGGKAAVHITKSGRWAAKKAIKELASGKQISDPLMAKWAKAYGIEHDDPKQAARMFSETFFSKQKPRSVNRGLSWLGEDLQYTGSRIADDVINPGEILTPQRRAQVEASRELAAHYGRAKAPGVRIGKKGGKWAVEVAGQGKGTLDAGTGFAHIPFTDIGLYGPAISPAARTGIATARMADTARNANQNADLGERATLFDRVVKGLDEAMPDVQQLYVENLDRLETLRALRAGEAQPLGGENLRLSRIAELESEIAENTSKLREARDAVLSITESARNLSDSIANAEPGASNLGSLLYMSQELLPKLRSRADEMLGMAELARLDVSDPQGLGPRMRSALAERIAKRMETERAASLLDSLSTPDLPYQFDEDATRARVADEEYRIYRNQLDEEARDVFDRLATPERLNANIAYADTLHSVANARARLKDAVTASVLNTGVASRDRVMQDVAATIMGLGDEAIGSSPFASMDAVVDGLTGGSKSDFVRTLGALYRTGSENAAHRLIRYFGRPGGTLEDIVRRLARSGDPRSSAARLTFGEAFMRDLRQVAADTGAKVEDVGTVVRLLRETGGQLPPPGSPDAVALHDLVSRGMLDPRTNNGFFQAAKAVAEKWGKELDELELVDVAAGAMGEGMKNYFPRSLSLRARHAISRQKLMGVINSIPDANTREAARKEMESFARARGFKRYEWTDADGVQHAFNEGERWVESVDPKSFESLGEEITNHIRHVKSEIAAYNAFLPGTAPKGRYLTAMEVDYLASTGKLPLLLGADWHGPLYADAATSIADRYMHSERYRLGQFLNAWSRDAAIPINMMDLATMKGGSFVTKTGIQGEIRDMYIPGKGNTRVLRIGDKLYRRPNIDNPNATGREFWNPFRNFYAINAPDAAKVQAWYPEQLATEMERFAGVIDSEKTASEIAQAAEEITKYWKATTLLHPSWIITDVLSTIVLALNAAIPPLEIAKHFKNAMRIASAWKRGDREALQNIKITLNGVDYTGLDLIRPEVQGAGSAAETLGQVLANVLVMPQRQYELWSTRILTDKSYRKAFFNEIGERAKLRLLAQIDQNRLAQLPFMQRFLQAKNIIVDEGLWNFLWGPWAKTNAFANDAVRTAAFMAAISQGRGVDDAAKYISSHLLDVVTLTGFEREKIRPYIPFYTWMRASAAYGMRQLLLNPKFFTIAPHAKRAVEESINGEARIPEHQRPQWMREAIAIQLGSHPSTRRMFSIGQMVPSEAATYFATLAASPVLGFEALQDGIAYLGNSLNPAFKIPLEIGSGHEWFTGRTIGKEGDLTVPEYLTSQIRPIRELAPLGPRKSPVSRAFERGLFDGIARLTLGGKLQPGDTEFMQNQTLRETDKTEKALRRRINIAEREGDHEESLRARVMLLKLYQRRAQKGLGDEIPKWAKESLSRLAERP